ncbi:zinc finger, CCHC-type containing protein [Tanacetum coccineum]
MAVAAMKHIASNFTKLAKLDMFEGVDFSRWQKKMHFLFSSMSVVYVLTTPIPDDGDDATVDQLRKRAKWDNDDYVCRGLILNEAKYMAEDASSKKFFVSNFTNYKMTDSRPVLEQYNKLLGILGRFTQHKMNMDESIQISCIIDKLPPSWKDFKHTLKYLKEELTLVELGSHLRIEEFLRMYSDNKGKCKHHDNTKGDPNKKSKVTCWKCGKPGHLKKDCKGGKAGNKANDSGTNGATVHVCKDRCWFKTYESLNDGSILHMGNKSTALVHGRGCVDLKFSYEKIALLFNVLHVPNIRKNLVSSSVLNKYGYKHVIESNKSILSKHGVFIGFGYLSNQMFRLNIVNNNIASAFMSTSKLNDSILWHARLGHVHFKMMKDMSKDGLIPSFDIDTEKCKTCMLNKITKKPFQNVKRETEVLELIQSDLCDLHATPSLGNKKYFVTYIDDASRAVVRLLDIKLKTLDERGIECIFVRYARIQVYSLGILNGTEDIGGSVVPEDVTKEVVQQPGLELRKSKRNRTPKDFRPEFQLYLIEGTRDEVSDEHSYCFNVEDYPKKFNEAMKSQDVAFWKEAINDEMDSIMGNNTWVLPDLPPGCKPLGCKWIFKRKLKKSGIDYFDNYAPVARISTIRLLIAMASIHNMIIHQMDVKIAFLNGDLDEEAPKQWHQKFDEVVLSNGYLLNQADKCVYSKFDETSKGVIICQYVDDMLIFGTDQIQVDLTKEFLSLRFSMKDMQEADVILGIRIKHESNGITISHSHYIEKVLKKLNYFDCTPISTPMDTSEKLMPNNGQVGSHLEYSRVIGCLMYTMTCTRPDIAFVVGKLSRLTYTGYPLVLEGYTNASWISNTEDNSSIRGWVFLLSGGAISWASKKQTCITDSTMESEFVALAAAGKEAEWLKNLLLEIPLHLGVKHSMIRELITNRVISIEFVRSQQNLADHLTKGLTRDLVIKSAEGMGLKGLNHVYLHIIPRMLLELAEKKDEVFTSQWEHGLWYSNGLKGSILITPGFLNI